MDWQKHHTHGQDQSNSNILHCAIFWAHIPGCPVLFAKPSRKTAYWRYLRYHIIPSQDLLSKTPFVHQPKAWRSTAPLRMLVQRAKENKVLSSPTGKVRKSAGNAPRVGGIKNCGFRYTPKHTHWKSHHQVWAGYVLAVDVPLIHWLQLLFVVFFLGRYDIQIYPVGQSYDVIHFLVAK